VKVRCPMAENKVTLGSSDLPEFLRISVRRGLVSEATARRIELYRRTRGLDESAEGFEVVHMRPDPHMTFNSFVQCKGNAFAIELARIVAAETPGTLPYNPIYVYSEVGMGKTHLLSAIANELLERNAVLVNTVDLAADFSRARRTDGVAPLRQWLSSMDLLLIDDIQLCEGDESLQMDLFSILNHMINDGRWVVISSDAYPTRLIGMESRLLSRLRGGVIVGLQMPDRSERLAILKHLTRDAPFPTEVLEYLAANITESVRQLKAATLQIRLAASKINTPVSLDMARSIIFPTPELAPPLAPSAGPRDAPASAQAEDKPTSAASADRFKKMLSAAETEEEQVLALQIALGERIRQLRNSGSNPEALAALENALALLRDGHMDEAVACLCE
jgi:hypothetical protein